MKKLFFTFLTICLLSACANSKSDSIKEAINRQLTDFPESTLLDIYKSFFQDKFGPGHIAPDSIVAMNSIIKEIESATKYDRHYYEPTGEGTNFYRVSLATISDSIVPIDVYFNAFYNSIKNIGTVDIESWKSEWGQIMEVISSMNINLPDFDNDKASIDSLLNNSGYVSHHSRRYNNLYQPHYRLIRKDLFFKHIKPLIDASRVIEQY